MSTRAAQIEMLMTPLIDPTTLDVCAGYKAYFYAAGTSTPKSVWTELAKTNPFTSYDLDSGGKALLYGDGLYKIVVKNADGATVLSVDNIKIQATTYSILQKTGAYTVTPEDDIVLCSGTWTLSIQTVANFERPVTVKNYGSGTITIDPYSTQQVNGATTYSLAAGASVVLYPDTTSTAWRVSFSDSSNIYFTQSGTGATARTLQAKVRDIIHVKDFGATGDGVTDDTSAVQAAITAAAGNTLEFGGSDNTYVITSTGTKHAITCVGTLGSSEAINSGANIYSYTVNVTDASDFAAEDFCLIASGDHYSYTGQDTDFGEILQIRSISSGDIVFATPLTNTYSSSPVLYPVTWKENVSIEGLDIRGSNTTAAGERGICLRYVKNFSIRNCKIYGIDHYGIEINSSINGEVRSNFIKGVFYDSTSGTIFYGIIVMNSSQYVNVVNNIGHKNRHLVVCTANTGGAGYFGQPMFINVEGNIFHDAESGDAGRSYAFENHGFGRFINWRNNIANGCYAGFRIENGSNNIVSGNIIRNYAYSGLIIGGNGQGATNLRIEGNEISGMKNETSGDASILVQEQQQLTVAINAGGADYETGDILTLIQAGASGATFTVTAVGGAVTAVTQKTNGAGYTTDTGLNTSSYRPSTKTAGGTGCTLDVSAVAWSFYNNLVIKSNVIRDPTNTYSGTNYEAAIRIKPNTYRKCSIGFNDIYSSIDMQLYAIIGEDGADNLFIHNNEIYGYRGGIQVIGNRCVVRGNVIRNDSAKASGFGIYSDGVSNVVQGNTIAYIHTVVRIESAATDNLVLNNQAIDCTVGTVSDAGTTTVDRDNDAI